MSATATISEGKAKGKAGKLKLVVVAAAVLAAVAAGGWFSGLIPKLLHKPHEAEAAAAPTFLEMPEVIANMNAGGRRAAFIKLRAKLELSRREDEAAIQAAMPRVLDLFQGYLREMRPEELRGTAGTYRLREELAARINLAAPPARVVDVLFVELIVQ